MSTDRANTLTEVRAEMLNESTRTLVLINGGGAVAVATWLQAIWNEPWAASMLRPQITGAAILLLGVALASICPFVRYVSSFHRNTLQPFKNPWWWVHSIATVLSVAAFIAGMARVIHGAMDAL